MEDNKSIYTDAQCAEMQQELQEYFWEEYERYILETPMTKYERRMLRKWVSEGHSVNQSPGSKYLPDRYPPADFLETYREDREITRAIKGMNAEEKEAYLKEYMGWTDPTPEEIAYVEVRKNGSDAEKAYIKGLQRELGHLWEFIWQEGLGDEAKDFVMDHRHVESAFEW